MVPLKPDAEPSRTGTPVPSGAEVNVQQPPPTIDTASAAVDSTETNGTGVPDTHPTTEVIDETMNGEDEDGEMDTPAPPTTRSKTAPQRKQPTPDPSPGPPDSYQRPVITLSDVNAARDVLAERANAHWLKGLGGGQNKEGETIVNFLYKMKVGHGQSSFTCDVVWSRCLADILAGRLLRVYNPPGGPQGPM